MAARICVTHLGFHPRAEKRAVVLLAGAPSPEQTTFRVVDVGTSRAVYEGKLEYREDPFGRVAVAAFSEVTAPGLYQVRVGDRRSVPFFVRQDVYTRSAYDAFHYFHVQRCGQAVADWHDACHLDDARRRDTGEYVDVTGGWHDAGDLRKWMSATMWAAVAMAWLKRYWAVSWHRFAPDDVLDELAWGNRYFLKMCDPTTGQVWHDTAGGVNGDNSDNHWTDNEIGTADDRYVTVGSGSPQIQWTFVYMQALVAQAFWATDPAYSRHCLAVAKKAFEYGLAHLTDPSTLSLSLQVLACVEMARSGIAEAAAVGVGAVETLLRRQVTSGPLRGALRSGPEIDSDLFRHAWLSGVPALALLEAMAAGLGDAKAVEDSLRSYLEEYVGLLVGQSAFRILPFSAWLTPRTPDRYRPLPAHGYFRFFMPVLQEGTEPRPVRWWVGTSSHLLSHAVVLGLAAERLSEPKYRDWAYSQLQWVLGGNPFEASLMTGHGINQPWPHSRFVGLIPGGIMNGIGGDEDDQPVLDRENGLRWQTNEYWTPHNAFYLMALSVLERPQSITETIGVIRARDRQ